MKRSGPIRGWLWLVSFGLGLCVVTVFCVLLVMHNQEVSTDPVALETRMSSAVEPSPLAPTALTETPSQLPRLNYPLGSVEEGCSLSEFPSYWEIGDDFLNNKLSQALESAECNTALEVQIDNSNPYIWSGPSDIWSGQNTENVASFAFFVLEEPLTFERIFADPAGDLARVQDALSRPECLLTGDETNWELKESCSADAFMNYAMSNRYCYNYGSTRAGAGYVAEPTPAQNVARWRSDLEEAWIEKKCDTFAPELKLTADRYPELTKWLWSLTAPDERDMAEVIYGRKKILSANLIEYAARLGDNAAGLTTGNLRHPEAGAVYGRFSALLTSDEWYEFATKDAPSSDRFRRTFKMLVLASSRRPDPRDEIEFDWEFVAQHLCTPPFFDYEELIRAKEMLATSPLPSDREKALALGEIEPPKSCQEVVHELRQQDIKFAPLLQMLDKFEQVALELGVYE